MHAKTRDSQEETAASHIEEESVGDQQEIERIAYVCSDPLALLYCF